MKRCADSNIWSRCTHRSGQFANLLSWIPQPRKQAARIILFQLVRMLNLHASDVNRCLSRSACLWPAPAIVVLEEPWLKDFFRCNSWCPIRLRAGTVGNHVVHHARTLPFSACHCHSSGCQQPGGHTTSVARLTKPTTHSMCLGFAGTGMYELLAQIPVSVGLQVPAETLLYSVVYIVADMACR